MRGANLKRKKIIIKIKIKIIKIINEKNSSDLFLVNRLIIINHTKIRYRWCSAIVLRLSDYYRRFQKKYIYIFF
jgi:hypothetical protein